MFVPELARGVIGHFTAAIGGAAQYRKASFLLGAEGEQVFPDFVQLREDPFIPQALGSANFDAEGVATRAASLRGSSAGCGSSGPGFRPADSSRRACRRAPTATCTCR